ncbi:MAG: FAD-dependent oxidoreductase [Planctomycetaceae bacterium]|nr:FAD-dependent oxidoreductase [Planctomycetaceae bacterium]
MIHTPRTLFVILLSLVLAGVEAKASAVSQKTCDLLIVGGTESGWAAAIQAARMDVPKILIVHDGEWLGGQYTEQALACVDENKGTGRVGWGVDWHPMKRSFHRSGLFKELMDQIEAFNTEKYGSPMPGKPWHGPSTFRPTEAETVFRGMLQPYIDSGQVEVIWNHYPVQADVDSSGDHPRLTGLSFAKLGTETPSLHVSAGMTIDASDWGDAIQVSGTGFEYGPDPPERYGEPSAPKDAPLNEMNPITWAMIVEESDGETPISQPANFDDRNYPRATPFSHQEFAHLNWDVKNPGLGSILHWPPAGQESKRQLSVYSVRRIVDGYSSKDGKTSILLNYMNGQDYPLERLPKHVVEQLEATEPGASQKNIVVMTREQREIVFNDAKQHALGVLYHLQNFVHDRAQDKANSFRNFHLSSEFGTADHLPPKPYIRESLRLKAMYMMREQDGRNRDGETKTKAKPRFSHVMYPDGLFAWQFHYDFHRTGRTYLVEEGDSGPWIDYHKPNRHTKFLSDRCVFPLRSLIPETMDGLIGAQGNVGFSSIVSAAIRLHDQRIHIGQAAGATAAVALKRSQQPRAFPYDREKLEELRDALCGGTEGAVPLLIWPFRDLKPADESFAAVNRLAMLGLLPLSPREVDFHPDELADEPWMRKVLERSGVQSKLSSQPITRGQFCQKVWKQVQQQGWDAFAFERKSPSDVDGDGIADSDDALLYTPNEPITFKIDREPLTPETDGLPRAVEEESLFAVDFCGPGVKPASGFQQDRGERYSEKRGYGWSRSLTNSHRKRNAVTGAHDSFIFTRTNDRWELELDNGDYLVELCVGDSGHEQLLQSVVVEGESVVERETTDQGRFREVSAELSVQDGRLTIDIGSGEAGSNTCLNWVRVFKRKR